MVIWLIGLSSSGKTTLGRYIYDLWKKNVPNTVLVDGDEIRSVFKHDKGSAPYTIEGRRKNADRICNLCAWLDKQDINVVCCILSLFEESRRWNRINYSKYYEVYISVSMENLISRDNKNLYGPALRGETKDVVGVDIPFNAPDNPNYIFDNNTNGTDLRMVAVDILRKSKAI